MKTNELTGAALDWAVHVALHGSCEGHAEHEYSTDWSQGGPIIEREWLEITPWPNESDEELRWQCKQHDSIDCVAFGPTSLVAAMRCYVASKLGDEIDLPKELT